MNNQEYQAVLNKQGIKVTAELLGNALHSFGEKETPTEKRPHYKITVSGNGNSETFDFWGSIMDYYKSIRLPENLWEIKTPEHKAAIKALWPFGMPSNIETQLRKHNRHMKGTWSAKEYKFINKPTQPLDDAPYDAFDCILSDALSGEGTFNGFCGNFGYDTDSQKAESIYRECQKSLDKLRAVYSGDLYDLVNSLER